MTPHIHMLIYLQVTQISQALIFVTRSHGFFFLERPSFALMGAFCVAQLVSSIIAGWGDWGFTDVAHVSGGWIGIVWVWNIVTFFPLDIIKFAMKFLVKKYRSRKTPIQTARVHPETGIPLTKTKSRASVHGSLYRSRTNILRTAGQRLGLSKKATINRNELRRFASYQVQTTGTTLARSASRPAPAGA